jgi:hypothetical protein
MPAYTVFEPPRRDGDVTHTDRFVFVRDGFSWGAFLLGPIWMLWRGLWLVLLSYVVLMAALEGALRQLGVPLDGRMAAFLLIALLLGLEGASLRRRTLRRRGWREVGIVVADDLEAAERRFFELWVAGRPPAPPRPVPAPASSARPEHARASDIIGLFPEPGGRR